MEENTKNNTQAGNDQPHTQSNNGTPESNTHSNHNRGDRRNNHRDRQRSKGNHQRNAISEEQGTVSDSNDTEQTPSSNNNGGQHNSKHNKKLKQPKPQPVSPVPMPRGDANLKVVEDIEIEVPDPDYDASEDIATSADIEAYAREMAEKRARKQHTPTLPDADETIPAEEAVDSTNMPDPDLEPDPTLPWAKFDDSPFLSRGCNQCPKSYVPVDERELRSCCKVGSYNWMKGIRQPCSTPFDCVEVRFKNNRKDFFRLPDGIDVSEGDVVAVEGAPGHDVGIVSLIGEACRIQMEKKQADPTSETIKKLFRRAKAADIERWAQAIYEEHDALLKTRAITEQLGLVMKVNDVEYQGDHSKAIFYYTADDRVDFRSLIKVLAEEFHVRVEMKQIGVRQEAGKVGGIGTCGRELCCSTWLTNFKSVTTSVAKAQQILPNPQKLAGQCGKLKCCLNFEYEVYLDALKKFPPANTPIRFKKGLALYKKTDVLRGIMWYAYEGENDLYAIGADDVKAIIEMNRQQQYPERLEDYQKELMSSSALTQETSDAEFERELKLLADTNEDNGTRGEEKRQDRRNDRGDRSDRSDRGNRNDRRPSNGDRRQGDHRGRKGDRGNDHRQAGDRRSSNKDRRSNEREQ